MAKIYTVEEALAKMRLQCSRAEHSAREIREKLRRMGLSAADTCKIVEWLKDNRYVDDERFAEAFVRDKFMFAKWGRRKIAYALAGKGIPAETVRAALSGIDGEEYLSTAKKLVKAKIRGEEISDYEGRNKIFRWLLSRGFESDIASEAVKSVLKQDV